MPSRLIVLSCLALLAGAATAQSYKWRDAEGKLHISDKPPPGSAAEKIDYKPAVPDDPEATQRAGAMRAQRDDAAFAEKQAKQKAVIAAKREQRQNERDCLAVKRDLDVLNRPRPVYRVGKDGERQYVEDNARAAEIQKKQALAKQYCR